MDKRNINTECKPIEGGTEVHISFEIKVVKQKKHEAPSLTVGFAPGDVNVKLQTYDQKTWHGCVTANKNTEFNVFVMSTVNKGGSMKMTVREPGYIMKLPKTEGPAGPHYYEFTYKVG